VIFFLYLSPTDEGDASSPHGATCIQYQINGDGNTITAINSKSPSPSSPTGMNNEGLTRQQLDLISQIMQQTKQANGHKTTVQRPRTWNMQVRRENAKFWNPFGLKALLAHGRESVKTILYNYMRSHAAN